MSLCVFDGVDLPGAGLADAGILLEDVLSGDSNGESLARGPSHEPVTPLLTADEICIWLATVLNWHDGRFSDRPNKQWTWSHSSCKPFSSIRLPGYG